MITPLDMAETHLRKNKNKYDIRIYPYMILTLNSISKKLDSRFDINTREGFYEYIEFFYINDLNDIYSEILSESNSGEYYFYSLTLNELGIFFEEFKRKYTRGDLKKMFNLKNKKRKN